MANGTEILMLMTNDYFRYPIQIDGVPTVRGLRCCKLVSLLLVWKHPIV